MGRKFPTGENPTINPILSLSLLIACVVSIIAIISSLCGSCSRKKESSPERNSDDVFSQQNEVTKTLGDPLVTSPTENANMDDMSSIMSHSYQKPLLPPPPPLEPADMRHSRASSYHFQSNSIASFGRLTSSMSMRVQGGLSGLRQSSRREDSDKKKEKYFKNEDSIWKKQIILGEKCRVPDEDDTIICDEKGNRISTYHPKTPSSLTLSRQSSSIDPNAIPS